MEGTPLMGRLNCLAFAEATCRPVEQEAGAFGVELIGGEGLEHVDECELDGAGVLDGRQVEARRLGASPTGAS
jgi:hypothetical protein